MAHKGIFLGYRIVQKQRPEPIENHSRNLVLRPGTAGKTSNHVSEKHSFTFLCFLGPEFKKWARAVQSLVRAMSCRAPPQARPKTLRRRKRQLPIELGIWGRADKAPKRQAKEWHIKVYSSDTGSSRKSARTNQKSVVVGCHAAGNRREYVKPRFRKAFLYVCARSLCPEFKK